MGDIVEREGKHDMYQGGYTAGMEVAGRAFIVFTAICWILRIDRICTYTCVVDMSAFFDTIIPELVADQLLDEGVNSQIVHDILSLFEEMYAQMETATGTSRPTQI